MKKKIVAMALAFMLAIPVVGTGVAYAGNYTDSEFNFSFIGGIPWLTAQRDKFDYTSSYMKCTSTPYQYSASVIGISKKKPVDVGSPWYVFGRGTTTYMVNYVREKGYVTAAILGRPVNKKMYTAKGLWSPDSI